MLISISMIQAQGFTFQDLHDWHQGKKVLSPQVEGYEGNAASASNLGVEQKMMAGDRIWSPSKNHYAIMQKDGNFCIYTDKKAWVWCSGTTTPGSYLILQEDGNMCVYTREKRWLWDTRTHTLASKPATLTIDDNGTLHMNDKNGKSIWTNR
jgi:hypothetical protein